MGEGAKSRPRGETSDDYGIQEVLIVVSVDDTPVLE